MSRIKDTVNSVPPIAVALWLIDNSTLTFQQIANFCSISFEEIQSIADGLIGKNVMPINPILNGLLTKEELSNCEKNFQLELKKQESIISSVKVKRKKYTPMAQRRNRPEAVLWLLTFAQELSDSQIVKLIRTTKDTIEKIRSKTYKDYPNLIPKDPVIVGFCTQRDLNSEIEKAKNKQTTLSQQ
jgi:hypothetical protein